MNDFDIFQTVGPKDLSIIKDTLKINQKILLKQQNIFV